MKTILYLGTDPSYFFANGNVLHYPIIHISAKSSSDQNIKKAFDALIEYSHIIFTSKNAVRVFFEIFDQRKDDYEILKQKKIISIGRVTSDFLLKKKIIPFLQAEEETQEGIIEKLSHEDLSHAYIFFPRSSRSRPVLLDFLQNHAIHHVACDLYDTIPQFFEPYPDLKKIDEIVFTSPSTVEAFFSLYGYIPKEKKLTVVGPVTEEALKKRLG
jgi:uroporphyrinogen-III synthase